MIPYCSEQAYKQVNIIMEQLVLLEPSNKEPLLLKLIYGIEQMGRHVCSSLEKLIVDMESKPASVALSLLSYSISYEINLLRLLKAVMSIAKTGDISLNH